MVSVWLRLLQLAPKIWKDLLSQPYSTAVWGQAKSFILPVLMMFIKSALNFTRPVTKQGFISFGQKHCLVGISHNTRFNYQMNCGFVKDWKHLQRMPHFLPSVRSNRLQKWQDFQRMKPRSLTVPHLVRSSFLVTDYHIIHRWTGTNIKDTVASHAI